VELAGSATFVELAAHALLPFPSEVTDPPAVDGTHKNTDEANAPPADKPSHATAAATAAAERDKH
jgi:hypothetical protein